MPIRTLVNYSRDASIFSTRLIGIMLTFSVIIDMVNQNKSLSRVEGQSSIMSIGLRRLAEITINYCIVNWSLIWAEDNVFTGTIMFFFLVEITLGLFEFATISTSVYPRRGQAELNIWYEELFYLHSNTYFGLFSKLAYTLWPICVLLKLEIMASLLLIFAINYCLHEVKELIFIIKKWRETSCSMYQQGIEYDEKI